MDISKPVVLTELSVDELKSLAYDFTVARDNNQNNLNLVKMELDKRNKVEEAVVTEK